jgi:hypothetical protein
MKKKTVLIFLVILCVPVFSLRAGVRIGAKAGINLANADFNTKTVQTDNFTGFQIGPVIEFSGLTGFGIEAAALYSESGIKFTKGLTIINYEEKVNTLDIPVNLKYKISLANMLGCYFTAGPYVSFKLNSQTTFNQIKAEWTIKQFGTGVNFGAGFELLKHLQIGANYQIALNDDYRNGIAISDIKGNITLPNFKADTRIWSITATYFF